MPNPRTWTGSERALAALAFEPTDRVPLLGGFIAHAEALRQLSGIDPWQHPREAALGAARKLGVDLIIQLVLPKPRANSTMVGCDRESQFTDQEAPPFASAEAVRDHVLALPAPAEVRRQFDPEAYFQETLADWAKCEEEGGEDLLFLPYARARDCNFMYYSNFGYQPYFEAIALYPEVMWKLFRHDAEEARCRNEVVARAVREAGYPPYVYIGQDICDNAGPMISPQALDELYFPHEAYALEPLNDAGIKKVWHSDGNINPILERLLDCGVNGFQGLQEDTYLPEERKVSLARLAKMTDRHGDQLILFGSISVRDVLPHGTVEEVKREVERCIDACRGRSGFFVAPTSTVGPDVPVENIVAMYEHAAEYERGAS